MDGDPTAGHRSDGRSPVRELSPPEPDVQVVEDGDDQSENYSHGISVGAVPASHEATTRIAPAIAVWSVLRVVRPVDAGSEFGP
jgi:hypothetical protein